MPAANAPIVSLNSGEISHLALARIDLAKLRMAAERQENLTPTVLGPAIMRPGTAYQTTTRGGGAARLIPFEFSATTTAVLELSDSTMRVLLAGQPLTRPSVSAAFTNGEFTTDLTGWTDDDETGASSTWSSGALQLVGTGANQAIRTQALAIAATSTEHALRVRVSRGRALLRVGTSSGADDVLSETVLRPGYHSLAITPGAATVYVRLACGELAGAMVESIAIEAAGAVEIPTPWSAASINSVRYDQSGDVLFCACDGIRQQRIERYSQRSWSVVDYQAEDGPFLAPNASATTITPSGTTGGVTLTASRAMFKSTNLGSLFKLVQSGQSAAGNLSGAGQSSGYIRVSGLKAQRWVSYSVSGTFVGTVTLERAIGTPTSWSDAQIGDPPTGISTTAPVDSFFNDDLDNQIIYYRLSIQAGDYTSGSAVVTLTYAEGSQTGIVRITGFTSDTVVTGEVLSTLGSTTATSDWSEGAWSPRRGYPAAVAIADGRLWWAKRDTVYGSVSDGYESFDEELEGDAAPITRSIATGGFDGIYWLLAMQRLLAGTAAQEISVRSSSFDEPLTQTKFMARACSTRGSAQVAAVDVDTTGIFVQRDGRRVFELRFSVESGDYSSSDLTRLKPEMCTSGVKAMAVQRQPDTRVWCVLNDGTVALLTYERADEVIAWTKVSTDGLFESVCVLPGADEDDVYFVINRTIGGSPVRYIEKLAKQSEARPGTLTKCMDSHVVYSGAATTTITGLSHLNGKQVVVWADGAPLVTQSGMLTVSGGSVTLPTAASNAVVGLPYNGYLKTAKLGYGAALGTPLAQPKRVERLGLLLADFAWKGIRVGRSFDALAGIPPFTPSGRALTTTETQTDYDDHVFSFGGEWSTDARVCVQVLSPYPATLTGLVICMTTNDAEAASPARNR